VVDMNNRLEELRFMEEQEIYRIFQELCSQLYPIAEEIRISLRILGKLMQLTPSKMGSSMRGTLPKISQNGLINIKGARHPLIHRIV